MSSYKENFYIELLDIELDVVDSVAIDVEFPTPPPKEEKYKPFTWKQFFTSEAFTTQLQNKINSLGPRGNEVYGFRISFGPDRM